jgi:hypothetical protein
MSDEKTYTLLEAKRELVRMECGRHGHDWDILSTMAGPYALICGRGCGERYRVIPDGDTPTPGTRDPLPNPVDPC